MSNQGNVTMHNDCVGCDEVPNLTQDQWIAFITKGAEGLGAKLSIVECYDAKNQWKKIEIIYDSKPKEQ